MELTEDEIMQKYAKNCEHCKRNALLPYEYEFICLSCGNTVNKRKHELSKIQRKKINFKNRLKHAEQKIFCICIDVYKNYENVYGEKKLKIINILIEKNKDLLKNPDFEQDYWSGTATGIYKFVHESIRLMKWICYYDRSYYENFNYYDLKGIALKCLNEIS